MSLVENSYMESRMSWQTALFQAELKYDDTPPYRCECCVFRQWVEKSSGGEVYKKMHRDNTLEGGKEYGGEREDGSNGDSPDNEKKKGEGTWESSPCLLYFEDNPREGGALRPGEWHIKYTFVGIVFDRCNKWKPVAARAMTMERKTSYVNVGGDPAKDKAPDLDVQDDPKFGPPKLTPHDGPPK